MQAFFSALLGTHQGTAPAEWRREDRQLNPPDLSSREGTGFPRVPHRYLCSAIEGRGRSISITGLDGFSIRRARRGDDSESRGRRVRRLPVDEAGPVDNRGGRFAQAHFPTCGGVAWLRGHRLRHRRPASPGAFRRSPARASGRAVPNCVGVSRRGARRKACIS